MCFFIAFRANFWAWYIKYLIISQLQKIPVSAFTIPCSILTYPLLPHSDHSGLQSPVQAVHVLSYLCTYFTSVLFHMPLPFPNPNSSPTPRLNSEKTSSRKPSLTLSCTSTPFKIYTHTHNSLSEESPLCCYSMCIPLWWNLPSCHLIFCILYVLKDRNHLICLCSISLPQL